MLTGSLIQEEHPRLTLSTIHTHPLASLRPLLFSLCTSLVAILTPLVVLLVQLLHTDC